MRGATITCRDLQRHQEKVNPPCAIPLFFSGVWEAQTLGLCATGLISSPPPFKKTKYKHLYFISAFFLSSCGPRLRGTTPDATTLDRVPALLSFLHHLRLRTTHPFKNPVVSFLAVSLFPSCCRCSCASSDVASLSRRHDDARGKDGGGALLRGRATTTPP